MMIIDAHTHIMPQRRLNGLSYWLGKVFADHPMAGQCFTEDTIVEDLSRKGTDYIFNYVFSLRESETEELNLFNKYLSEKFASVIPFGCIHAENRNIQAIIDLCIKTFGFRGFKLHPYVQGFSPDDERLFPAYERMEELGVMVNIHTGFDEYYPQKEKTITLSMIEGLICRFPSLDFILSHMFYPRLDEAVYLVENFNNVILDTTNVFSAIIQDEEKGLTMDKERELLSGALKKWSQRMVFGTDYPAGMSTLDGIYRDLCAFGLSKNVKQDILCSTAENLVKGKNV
ncbi:amidohydrolase family protein [Desulfosarcina widdelii]|nr:amidohydrolase family protein [Desulfosarcina widdelii]